MFAMDWDYDEGTLLADSSLKVTRRFVDPITFSSWVSVARLPRIEDCDHEMTVFKIVQPRFCGHKDLKGHVAPKQLSLSPPLTVSSLSPPRGKSPVRSNGTNRSNISVVDSDKVQKDTPNASQKKDSVRRLGVGSDEVNKGRVVVLRGGNCRKIAGNDDKDGKIPPSTNEPVFRNAGNNGTLEGIHDNRRGDDGIPPAFRTNSPFQSPSHQKIDFHNISDGFPSVPPPPAPPMAEGREEMMTPLVKNTKSAQNKSVTEPPLPRSPQAGLQKTILRSPTKSPSATIKARPKNSLDAFLHRNAVDQFISTVDINGANNNVGVVDDDHASIGSRSMSSRSVSDRSFAERSKSEASLAKKSKTRLAGRRNGGTSIDDGTISSVASSTSHTRRSGASSSSAISSHHSRMKQLDDDPMLAMQPIDEQSITDFSSQSPRPTIDPLRNRSPKKVKAKKNNQGILPYSPLGAFLDQNGSSDDDDDDDDHRSTATASTMGSKSISTLSKAEQSGLEKKLRKGKRPGVMNNQEQVTGNVGLDLTDVGPPQTPTVSHLSDMTSIELNGVDTGLSHRKTPPSLSIQEIKLNVITTNSIMKGTLQPTALHVSHDDDEQSLDMGNVGPVDKKLRFKDGHSEREVPELTDSMFDDLFYTSEELADFRYEAFMEEAGLDINEFM
jgi:hypothetical protein